MRPTILCFVQTVFSLIAFSVLAHAESDPNESLRTYLQTPASQRADLSNLEFAKTPLNQEQVLVAQQLLSDDYLKRVREERRKEFEDRVIKIDKLSMPFSYKVFGDKPAAGRSLVISMHGGGNAPKRVNDQQWENQKRLYQLDEGVYVAPRAPTDTWDLWHQSHIDAFLDRLIEDMVAFEDVDSDRVYLMGYSAGGDGVFQLAPRMADRFAAAAMMAGHPNETSPLGLRNLPFTLHMGEKDSAYNRNKIASEWDKQLSELQNNDQAGYVHLVKLHAGKGHWMDRQDAEALPWMYQFTRQKYPKRIVWKQDDVVEPRFYWLKTNGSEIPDRALVTADLEGQKITIQSEQLQSLTVRLNDEMLDLSKEVQIDFNSKEVFRGIVPRTIQTIYATLQERGDPKGMFCGTISVP